MQRFCRQFFRLSLRTQKKVLPVLHFSLISHPKFSFSQFHNGLKTQEIKFDSQDSFYKPLTLDQNILSMITSQVPEQFEELQLGLDLYQSGKDMNSFSEEEALRIFQAVAQLGLCYFQLSMQDIGKEWIRHAVMFGSKVPIEKFGPFDALIYSHMGVDAFKIDEFDLSLPCVENVIKINEDIDELSQEDALEFLQCMSIKVQILKKRGASKEIVKEAFDEAFAMNIFILDTYEDYDEALEFAYNKCLKVWEGAHNFDAVEKYARKGIGIVQKKFGEDAADAHCTSFYQRLLNVFVIQGRLAEAVPYAEKLRKGMNENKNAGVVDRIAASSVLANIYYRAGDFKNAIKVYEEFDNHPEKESFLGEFGEGVSFPVAECYKGLGEFQKANEYFVKELEFLKMKNGELSLKVCNCLNRGVNLFCDSQELREECKSYFEKLIELSEKVEMSQEERLHYKLGYPLSLCNWGDFATSLKYSKEAESLLNGLPPSDETELLYRNLGECLTRCGRFEEALKYFEKAIQHCEATGMVSGEMLNYHMALVGVYSKLDNQKMVSKWLTKTLAAIKKISEDDELMEIYKSMFGMIVNWLVQKERTDEAAKVLKMLKKTS